MWARPRSRPFWPLPSGPNQERGAESAVLTSALHRSFQVGRDELLVVRDLDGTKTPEEIAKRAGTTVSQVRSVRDRFERYAFFRGAS